MKGTEIAKTLSFKKQTSLLLRNICLLILSIVALLLGYFFQEQIGMGLLITSTVIAALFLILTTISICPMIKELAISKTYQIYEGRVIEVKEYSLLKSVYMTIDYESPLVNRIDTHACFYPMEGRMLFGKKLKIAVSKKSKKALILP